MEKELEELEEDIWIKILVSLHPFYNIETTIYTNYEPTFNVVFTRNNSPRIKDGAYE